MNALPGWRVWVPKSCQESCSQCVATGRTNSLDGSDLGRRGMKLLVLVWARQPGLLVSCCRSRRAGFLIVSDRQPLLKTWNTKEEEN